MIRIALDAMGGDFAPKTNVIGAMEAVKKFNDIDLTIALYKDLFPFEGVFPISVLKDKNVDVLLNTIVDLLPNGPKFYPDEMISDHDNRFLASELIREKILEETKEEVPHSIAVTIDSIEQNKDNPDYLDFYATIYCERDSQKKIIIGHGGELIKRVKNRSINDIKKLYNRKIHLDLWVKVKKDWKDRPNDLVNLGYSKDNF